jgi:hypothetical protein
VALDARSRAALELKQKEKDGSKKAQPPAGEPQAPPQEAVART